jgi:hypothetical protein
MRAKRDVPNGRLGEGKPDHRMSLSGRQPPNSGLQMHLLRSLRVCFYILPKFMIFSIPLREGFRRQFGCILSGIPTVALTQLKRNPPGFNCVNSGKVRHRSEASGVQRG